MFSANENIVLRQYKRRIIEYVEESMSEEALEMGTMVMVMQVSCKAPGCVPLETLICIVFPKHQNKELVAGLAESGTGGTYKTKVLMPMSEVTKDDVLDALPPPFKGGRRSMARLCLQARDVMLGQITQMMADDDFEGKKLMANYLMATLQDYLDRGCVPPDFGQEFKPLPEPETPNLYAEETNTNTNTNTSNEATIIEGSRNLIIRRPIDSNDVPAKPQKPFVVTISTNQSTPTLRPSANDWRRQQSIDAMMYTQSSSQLLVQLSQREHSAGIRQVGCPCCDPDNPSNYVDSMMML